MFRKPTASFLTALLPAALFLGACGPQLGVGVTPTPTPLPLTQSISGTSNVSYCQSISDVDTDADGICDKVDPCKTNSDCNGNLVPDGEEDDGGTSGWKIAGLSLMGLGSAWTLANCVGAYDGCFDYQMPWNYGDVPNENFGITFGDLDAGTGEFTSENRNGVPFMKLKTTATMSDDIRINFNGHVVTFGKKASVCILSPFAIRDAADIAGGVQATLQLQQLDPTASSVAGERAVPEAEYLNICNTSPGIWIGAQRDPSKDEWNVKGLPPTWMGFRAAEGGARTSDARIVFEGLTTPLQEGVGTGLRFYSLSDPTNSTRTEKYQLIDLPEEAAEASADCTTAMCRVETALAWIPTPGGLRPIVTYRLAR